MDSDCYYNNNNCEGECWQCLTCNEYFCETHWHETTLGRNVECVACEYTRNHNHEAPENFKDLWIEELLSDLDKMGPIELLAENRRIAEKGGYAGNIAKAVIPYLERQVLSMVN